MFELVLSEKSRMDFMKSITSSFCSSQVTVTFYQMPPYPSKYTRRRDPHHIAERTRATS
jgi:hypothetical protein